MLFEAQMGMYNAIEKWRQRFEQYSVHELYTANGGTQWVQNEGWKDDSPLEKRFGITLTSDRVSSIRLARSGLSGALPPALGLLTSLESLQLSGNSITGLPDTVASLSSLTVLDLSANSLVGPVPLCIAALTQLRALDLSGNQLDGRVPKWIGELKFLEKLSFADNHLYGHLPEEVADCIALREVRLQHNDLSGAIPSLISLTALRVLECHGNQFTGPPPVLPESIERVTMTGSRKGSGFAGRLRSIFSEFGVSSMCHIVRIDLGSNTLAGRIPTVLERCALLEILILRDNYISGTVPEWMGSLSRLKWIDISGNNLSGAIPSTLAKLVQLETLLLHRNSLEGEVPIEVLELAAVGSLRHLSLQYNPRLCISSGRAFHLVQKASVEQNFCESIDVIGEELE